MEHKVNLYRFGGIRRSWMRERPDLETGNEILFSDDGWSHWMMIC